MAEGLLRKARGKRFEVFSAGTNPRPSVYSAAIRTANDEGIDIRAQSPKDLKQFKASTSTT
jgi:protein-tyrosine-phosphatase